MSARARSFLFVCIVFANAATGYYFGRRAGLAEGRALGAAEILARDLLSLPARCVTSAEYRRCMGLDRPKREGFFGPCSSRICCADGSEPPCATERP